MHVADFAPGPARVLLFLHELLHVAQPQVACVIARNAPVQRHRVLEPRHNAQGSGLTERGGSCCVQQGGMGA
eukprot:3067473-Rhodomonas_salina.2